MCLSDHCPRVYRAVSSERHSSLHPGAVKPKVTLSEGFSSPDYSDVSTLGFFIRRSHWSRTERNAINTTLNTVWNDVASANYGQSKEIAAANVRQKQFEKLQSVRKKLTPCTNLRVSTKGPAFVH